MKDTMEFTLIETLGTIAQYTNYRGETMTKEVNLISWNNGNPKIDIREWTDDHSVMTRGMVFSDDEIRALAAILQAYVGRSEK